MAYMFLEVNMEEKCCLLCQERELEPQKLVSVLDLTCFYPAH